LRGFDWLTTSRSVDVLYGIRSPSTSSGRAESSSKAQVEISQNKDP